MRFPSWVSSSLSSSSSSSSFSPTISSSQEDGESSSSSSSRFGKEQGQQKSLRRRRRRQQPASFTVTRHYYKQTQRTEQSLDVYEPENTASNDGTDTDTPTKPTIVLVMGSGWLGHVWWIYTGTNWWNASGPATIARLGYRCISVRHSGGFFQVPNPLSSSSITMIIIAVFFAIAVAILFGHDTDDDDNVNVDVENKEYNSNLYQEVLIMGRMCIIFPLSILAFWKWLHSQSVGAAQLDDMVQDVADALQFIRSSDILLKKKSSNDSDSSNSNSNSNKKQERTIILGGYSSGGHVVATLLSDKKYRPQLLSLLHQQQQQQQQQQHSDKDNNDDDEDEDWMMIQGILYLSAVLSLDSFLMNFVTWSVFGKWATQVPSPHTERDDVDPLPLPTTTTTSNMYEDHGPSFFLPHLIVGCYHETFGVPVLDATFCAQAYTNRLLQRQKQQQQQQQQNDDNDDDDDDDSARCVLVDSNHWSVLNSRALSLALEEHLPWLVSISSPSSFSSTTYTTSRQSGDKQQKQKQHPMTAARRPALESTVSMNSSNSSDSGINIIAEEEQEE